MWPAKLPAVVRDHPLRQAEVKVYDRLQRQLDASWTVFYSRPWLGLTPTGEERDGEADFIVAHPTAGVLSIEVKGGAISYDPATDIWRSTDRSGIPWKIKDPVGQARSAKHELLKKLAARRDWPTERTFRARHGVVFPDAESPPGNLGPDRPRELFCCRGELADLADWIGGRLTGGNRPLLGRDGVKALERLLAQPFLLRVPLGHLMQDDDEAIEVLTPEQFHVLEATTAFNNRVAAGGAAGAGKTIVAMEDAARLAADGQRTLFTCASEPLAQDVRRRLADTPVVILSFRELSDQLSAAADMPPAPSRVDEGVLAERLATAIERRPDLRFDAVIVDEAQDVRTAGWLALDALLADPTASRLHAFFDTNQSLYGAVSKELAGFSMAPVHLGRNLRNTRLIHQAASRFYKGLPVRADGPEGLSIEWLTVAGSAVVDSVALTVRRLMVTDAVPPGEIAVLVPDAADEAVLARAIPGPIGRGLTLSTIAGFKGLERRVVVLVATRTIADERELAYVGLSRARAHLIVIGVAELIDWLQGESMGI